MEAGKVLSGVREGTQWSPGEFSVESGMVLSGVRESSQWNPSGFSMSPEGFSVDSGDQFLNHA